MKAGPASPSGPAGLPAEASAKAGTAEERLAPLFVGIVVVEILAIVGLYWMGVHFS